MKKYMIILGCVSIATSSPFIKADDHTYYSDNDNARHESHHEHWREYNTEDFYQKNPNDKNYETYRHKTPSTLYIPPNHITGQPPIQVYVLPNQRPSKIEQQYQEDRYWQERRAYIEGMTPPPNSTYRENPFYRDDNHW